MENCKNYLCDSKIYNASQFRTAMRKLLEQLRMEGLNPAQIQADPRYHRLTKCKPETDDEYYSQADCNTPDEPTTNYQNANANANTYKGAKPPPPCPPGQERFGSSWWYGPCLKMCVPPRVRNQITWKCNMPKKQKKTRSNPQPGPDTGPEPRTGPDQEPPPKQNGPYPTGWCPPGKERNAKDKCVNVCPPGKIRNPNGSGRCINGKASQNTEKARPAEKSCPPGKEMNAKGNCVNVCPPGKIRNPNGSGRCINGNASNTKKAKTPSPKAKTPSPKAKTPSPKAKTQKAKRTLKDCPPGQERSEKTNKCIKMCPPGKTRSYAGARTTCV